MTRLLTAALLLTACGTAPAAPSVPDWLHDPHMTVTYSITPDAVTCSNRQEPMAAADFPSGWWCHYRCGWMPDGHVSQAWIAFHEDATGHWIDAHEVYTGRCYDEGVTCPTCNFE
jgi:hypothetical protein